MVAQLKLIRTCFEIYRYVDFIHDRKKYVPVNGPRQPPKYLIDAYFYKMKADYMKFIFETLDCENGLLYDCDHEANFLVDVKKVEAREITGNDVEDKIDLAELF